MKMMTDELRLREATGSSMGLLDPAETFSEAFPTGRILLIEDRPETVKSLSAALCPQNILVVIDGFEGTLTQARSGDFDLIMVSLGLRDYDGLRLCSQLRSLPEGRNVPILVLVSEGDRRKLHQALEMGVNDYLTRPVDRNELIARVRTQLRKKRYADRLRENVYLSVEMAVTDQLTGLHNRRYLTRHLETLLKNNAENGKRLAILIIDVDFFKSINDTFGHDIGDEVLREFARRISENIRGIDLACRYGGEEFVVVMPETDANLAWTVAERLRKSVEITPFRISAPAAEVNVTVSVGVADSDDPAMTADALLRQADQALYAAKRDGRNRVVAHAA
jgi:two-component system cell cycle response regulator